MSNEYSHKTMNIAQNVLIEEPTVLTGDEFRGRYYELPGRPHDIIRAHDAATDAHEKAVDLLRVLAEMKSFGIPSVNPRFVMTGEQLSPLARHIGMKPEMIPLTISDRIVDAVSYSDVLENLDDLSVVEVALLHRRLFDYIVHVMDTGGDVIEDLLYSHQYVYSPGAPEGERMILVDIEPFGVTSVANRHLALDDGAVRTYLYLMTPFIQNVREYEAYTGMGADTRGELEQLIASIPLSDVDMDALRDLHLHMLQTPYGDEQVENKFSDRISELLFGPIDDWE